MIVDITDDEVENFSLTTRSGWHCGEDCRSIVANGEEWIVVRGRLFVVRGFSRGSWDSSFVTFRVVRVIRGSAVLDNRAETNYH